MNDNNVKIWHILLALVTLSLVIISMVYWLYANIDIKDSLAKENEGLKKELVSYKEKISELKNENYSLSSRPSEVKEITVKEECAPCPECKKNASAATKPVSIETVLCTKMSLGRWSVPQSCEKEVDTLLKRGIDKEKNFFVITPIVDTIKYKGKLHELKQAGLGQFRADSLKKLLKAKVDPNIYTFQKSAMQKKDMRGFVLELYAIEGSQE